jgi:hypothetical protein
MLQRYLESGFGYKYICSPFPDVQVAQLAPYIDLEADFPRLYWYDEAKELSGWEVHVNPDFFLSPGTGYAANFGENPDPVTYQLSGIVNNESFGPVEMLNTNMPFTTGFNLFGNPFPSPLNWEAQEGWNRTNIDDALYYFNAGTSDMYTGTYSTYINGISSDGVAGPVIPSMQACFIHVSDGDYPVSGSLEVNNAARTIDLNPVYHKSANASVTPAVKISVQHKYGTYADPLIIYFDGNASPKFDPHLDALKLINTDIMAPSLYAIGPDTKKLSVNSIPVPLDSILIIPLGLTIHSSGYYTIFVSEYTCKDLFAFAYLSDYKLIKLNPLHSSQHVDIQQTSTTDDSRFALILSKKELYSVPGKEFSSHAFSSGNAVFLNLAIPTRDHVSVNLFSFDGRLVDNRIFSVSGSYRFDTRLPKGIYILQILYDMKKEIIKLPIGF